MLARSGYKWRARRASDDPHYVALSTFTYHLLLDDGQIHHTLHPMAINLSKHPDVVPEQICNFFERAATSDE